MPEDGIESVPRKKSKWTFKPYLRDETDASEDQHLCSRCRSIDFKSIFGIDGRSLDRHGLPVFDLKMDLLSDSESQCALCDIFFDMISVHDDYFDPRQGSWHIRAFPKSCLFNYGRWKKQLKPEPIVLALFYRVPRKHLLTKTAIRQALSCGILRPSPVTHTQCEVQGGIQVSPKLPDVTYSGVKDLIHHCSHSHEECQQRKMAQPQGARVIDCISHYHNFGARARVLTVELRMGKETSRHRFDGLSADLGNIQVAS